MALLEDILNSSFANISINNFQHELLNWFDEHGRHWIPWKLKANGSRPHSGEHLPVFGIWVAEVMLQQTQLKVVLPYWERWMKLFPSIHHLASAEESEVLMAWQGLGYYSRARRLHQGAFILLDRVGSNSQIVSSTWPYKLDEWIAIPGIGRTTAGSIISSAFDLPVPILDGNVKRVLSRITARLTPKGDKLDDLWTLSEQLIPSERPRDFNQALMDLGAKICTPTNPKCKICPWRVYCLAYTNGEPSRFPVKKLKKKLSKQVIGIGIIFNSEGLILIDKRLDKGLLGGMWEFPGGKQELGEDIEETIAREIKEELAIDVHVGAHLISFDHSYTHKKLHFIVHICNLISGDPQPLESQELKWISIKDFDQYPFPAANQHIFLALMEFLKKH